MKRLLLLLLLVACVTTVSAQETDSVVLESTELKVKSKSKSKERPLRERKPLTTKWSFLNGQAKYASHYLNKQEYSGAIWGIEASFGRYYRRSDRLSWNLTMSNVRKMHRPLLGGGLTNAANTSYISTQSYDIDYAVLYNWVIADRLQLRAGGSFNLYGGFIKGDDNAVNNVITVDLQTQLYAHAQIRYGWDFKKWGLDLYANVSMPFIGFMTVDERYEGIFEALRPSDFNLKEHTHFKFSSMHNLQGVNYELGIDFALRCLAISLSYESTNRWWHAYELQSYRKCSLFKIGISVDLFGHKERKASNRQF